MEYCPKCGSELESKLEGGRDRPACPAEGCGFIHFGNFSIGAGAVVIRDGKALLIQRGIEPNRGAWQLPGGYIESDEEIIAGVEREVLEEAGIKARVSDVVGFRHAPGRGDGQANIYVVFRLDHIEGEPQHDGVETLGAGFFSLDEMEEMDKVQTLSTWSIQRALISIRESGLRPDLNREGVNMPGRGWSLFGLNI
ncbi:MAG: NUDIX hydrolase [SAR202 cluster bacterium]|nr:NUDIX hydrolase [SAR202 cluster bacterium]|tara:strand:+ start:1696 stop:2283 length:588 start_codon:yes stop_codon:yes gene_type:complete